MNLKGGYKIISLMAITLIAGAVGGDRTPITDEGILEQLDSLKEFLDESKQLKPILLRVKDSGNEVVTANLSKKTGEDILYINADLVDASLNVMIKFAQDEDTQEIYIDEASYLYIADVDKVAGEVAKAEEGTIVDALGLDKDGKLVKGGVSAGTKLYKHEIVATDDEDNDWGFVLYSIVGDEIQSTANLISDKKFMFPVCATLNQNYDEQASFVLLSIIGANAIVFSPDLTPSIKIVPIASIDGDTVTEL